MGWSTKRNGPLAYLPSLFREMVSNYLLESTYIMTNLMYFLSGMEKGTPPVLFEISLRLSAVKFPTIPILKTKTSGIDVVLSVMFCSPSTRDLQSLTR